ncbi:MAG TPA: ribonuclease HI [Candidatus Saccharimonadia bacterium]|nr:ribonuclease HI [Candidatus Saccharimonadia bacterium]
MSEAAKVEIHTDGACSGNPGPGGWAALLRSGSHEKLLSGAEPATTNNRMELTAAIRALEALKRTSDVVLWTDSQYVRRGVTEWLPRWKANGWRNSAKQPVANRELWEELDTLAQRHRVDWRWVRGHSGHPENDLVDAAARAAIGAHAQAREAR